MWYLAEILLAEPRHTEDRQYQCESCNVVFEAPTAMDAYRKAITWGQDYVSGPHAKLQLLGVSNLTRIGDRLDDGVEICGRFFESQDVWERTTELVPPQKSLKAILWESNQDTPIAEMLSSGQIAHLRRVL